MGEPLTPNLTAFSEATGDSARDNNKKTAKITKNYNVGKLYVFSLLSLLRLQVEQNT